MRASIVTLLLLLAIPVSATPPQEPSTHDDEARLMALETTWNQAESNRDAAALDQILASSFVYVDSDGMLMNKREFLLSIQDKSLQNLQVFNDGMHVQLYGDTAVVSGIYREQGILKGKAYSLRGRFTDTWMKQNGGWLCVGSQSTKISN